MQWVIGSLVLSMTVPEAGIAAVPMFFGPPLAFLRLVHMYCRVVAGGLAGPVGL